MCVVLELERQRARARVLKQNALLWLLLTETGPVMTSQVFALAPLVSLARGGYTATRNEATQPDGRGSLYSYWIIGRLDLGSAVLAFYSLDAHARSGRGGGMPRYGPAVLPRVATANAVTCIPTSSSLEITSVAHPGRRIV